MKLTSGFNFENYEITEYLGFCSGECVLGTGFFSRPVRHQQYFLLFQTETGSRSGN